MNPSPVHRTPLAGRLLAATGAVLAAASVGLSAYAAHAADPAARASLQSAALFAFGHGIALAVLGPRSRGLATGALTALLLGTGLFSGALVSAHFLATPTSPAPLGGGLMMLAWLTWAAVALRD